MNNTNSIAYIPVGKKVERNNGRTINVSYGGKKVSRNVTREEVKRGDDFEIKITSKKKCNVVSTIFFIIAALYTACIGEAFLTDETFRTVLVCIGIVSLFTLLGILARFLENYIYCRKVNRQRKYSRVS